MRRCGRLLAIFQVRKNAIDEIEAAVLAVAVFLNVEFETPLNVNDNVYYS